MGYTSTGHKCNASESNENVIIDLDKFFESFPEFSEGLKKYCMNSCADCKHHDIVVAKHFDKNYTLIRTFHVCAIALLRDDLPVIGCPDYEKEGD